MSVILKHDIVPYCVYGVVYNPLYVCVYTQIQVCLLIFIEQTHCNCTTNNQTVTEVTNTQRSGLSDGAVAGIAILLLILGIIIGVILQLTIGVAIRWFRTSSATVNIRETVKYKKQEENVSLD